MSTSHPTFAARPDSIQGWIIQVVRFVQRAALDLSIEFVMVGATARDIVLQSVFGLSAGRRTLDIDFGLAVEDWNQFAALKSELVATGNFQPVNRVSQRLLYRRELLAAESKIVDLIPFGAVEDKSGAVAWPPSRDIVLNVAGFREVLASAILVQMEPDLIVPVASLAGLAVLKLLAWVARRQETNKDANDLLRLLKDYGNAGNEDRLYGEELHLLEEAKFDFDAAGARMLGKDVASIVTADTAARIMAILQSEDQVDHLLLQMLQAAAVIDDRAPTRYAELLGAFRRGFLEA